MKWTVCTLHLRENGRLFGIARANGQWEAQEFRDGVEFIHRGRARTASLKAAKKACETFLKKNLKDRKAYFAARKA